MYLSSLGDTQSIVLMPPNKYAVFQNDSTPAIFFCLGNGAVVLWTLNGTAYNANHAQRGIVAAPSVLTGATVSSQLIIPSNSNITNNTQVVCRAADVTFSNVLTSLPTNLTIQGQCCNIYYCADALNI